MTFGTPVRAVVVDASVGVTFVSGHPEWVARWRGWAETDAIVLAPAHFPVEVANALLRSVRLSAADVAVALDRLIRSGVESVDRGLPGMLESIALADAHDLTVYDALYLQLAMDVDGELATLDGALIAAARTEGVRLVA